MEQKKLRWKDIYNSNKQRRYCEVTGIKNEGVELESNSLKTLKDRKYIAIIATLMLFGFIIFTFKNDIKILLMVLAFFLIAGICFFVFNYFKFECLKDKLHIRFGFQEGSFPYEKIKGVYLSKYNDYSFLIPAKRVYSIVIRYTDSFDRIKELSFPNYFLNKKNTIEFLDNFIIKEEEEEKYVQYERYKVLKMVGKVALVVLIILFVIGLFFIKR